MHTTKTDVLTHHDEVKLTCFVLKEKLYQIQLLLNELQGRRETLNKIRKKLTMRESLLSIKLLENINSELISIVYEIDSAKSEKNKIDNALREYNTVFLSTDTEVDAWIKEQAQLLVEEFLEYLGSHQYDIGKRIRTSFLVKEVSFVRAGYNYCVPTGAMGVFFYEDMVDELIVCTKDFQSEETLCQFTQESFGMIERRETKWYKNYWVKFTKYFFDSLKHQYAYGSIFNLTINDPIFTLDLI